MNQTLTLLEVRDRVAELLASQSPHVPTNIDRLVVDNRTSWRTIVAQGVGFVELDDESYDYGFTDAQKQSREELESATEKIEFLEAKLRLRDETIDGLRQQVADLMTR